MQTVQTQYKTFFASSESALSNWLQTLPPEDWAELKSDLIKTAESLMISKVPYLSDIGKIMVNQANSRHIAITDHLSKLADDANRTSGLIYELSCQRFTSMVDDWVMKLQEPERSIALAEALSFGYGDTDVMEDDGCCQHGLLDPDCCPLGCGDMY